MTSQDDQKMTKTRKIRIGKIPKFIFLSIQPIPDLSCEFEQSFFFWKVIFFFKNICIFLKKKNSDFFKAFKVRQLFFRIGGLQYEQVGINGIRIIQHQIKFFCLFFKINQIYMKYPESAEQKEKNHISDFSDLYFSSYGQPIAHL